MKQGGLVLFDTRDALNARPGGPPTAEAQWLRKFLTEIDIPALEILPRDHVVTKTFYLLDGFIGRTTDGQTLIEALPTSRPTRRIARRAPATAYRPSSSSRTISPRPGPANLSEKGSIR